VKLDVMVEGVSGSLLLEREQDRCLFTYGPDGAGQEATLIEVEPGIYSVLWNGCSYEAKVLIENENGSGFVDVGGRHYAVTVQDPRELSASRTAELSGREDVVAPMPGKVVRVLVEQGSQVEEGQGIAVVEAMKMQNEMPSPKSGRVVVLRAREGATVAAGELLATIE
jgi:biotin carboxyl carrier protein